VIQESASIRQRSFAAGFAEIPSFPSVVGRLNDRNVIFDKDLFDETELKVVPLWPLHESQADFRNSDKILSAACDIEHVPD
jgi:hypothetical protein